MESWEGFEPMIAGDHILMVCFWGGPLSPLRYLEEEGKIQRSNGAADDGAGGANKDLVQFSA